MSRSIGKISYIKLFTDIIVIISVFILVTLLTKGAFEKTDLILLSFLTVGWYFSTRMSNAYDDFRTERYIGELLLIFQNVLIQSIIAGQVLFILDQHTKSRIFVVEYVLVLAIVLIIKNYAIKKMLLYYRQKGGNIKNIVIVGYNEITANLITQIQNNPHYGFKVIGIIAKEEEVVDFGGNTYLGDLKKFLEMNEDYKIDEIIITTEEISNSMMQKVFLLSENRAIRTKIVPSYINYYPSRLQFKFFGNYPLITFRSEPLQEYHWKLVKRIFDIVFASLVFLFVFSWLFPIIAILIKLDSKGPVFFRQDRWGKDNKKFKCFKFRSMKPESSDVTEKGTFNQATQNDPRITKLGQFLRSSSLDEMPQFINVLLGDMSVVGPRPHAHEHNIRTKDEVDSYLVRHWIKPGITGWAQVNGYRGETKTIEQMEQRVKYDIWYIENWSLGLDFKIVFMTVYNMIKGEEMAY